MDLGLQDKTVLVTGSTAGIGFASARSFLQEGASVVLNGRTEARVRLAVDALKRELPDSAGRVRGVAASVADAGGVAELIAGVPQVDVLINNAGIFEPKPFEEIPDADWLRFFETNVMSGIRLSRHYLPGMLAKNWGRIVFVSSESALQIPVEMVHYGMTKTAQLAVARGLAERTRGTGITVNSVLPGPTKSEGVGTFVRALATAQSKTEQQIEQEFFATARPSSLLGRFTDSTEIANLIVYVASVAASATTGSSLRVDGGVVRSIA